MRDGVFVRGPDGDWEGRFNETLLKISREEIFINKCLSMFCLNFNVRKKFRWTFKNVLYYWKWPVKKSDFF